MPDLIRNNTERRRFELEANGHIAAVHYRLSPGVITFTHTTVPDALSGRGIGSILARHVLNYARAEGLMVDPKCPFVAAYMKKHPEYEDLKA